jgi:hypothetical protein
MAVEDFRLEANRYHRGQSEHLQLDVKVFVAANRGNNVVTSRDCTTYST